MPTHSSNLAQKISWTEELGGVAKESNTTEQHHQAIVHGVAKSQTRLSE